MEVLVLYKYHPSTQLAHLYEHLFIDALIFNLIDNGFLSYIDFTAGAKTFEDGLIEIEIVMRRTVSTSAKDILFKTKIKVDEDTVMTAIAQLVAEKKRSYTGDEEFIYSQLASLDRQKWQAKPAPERASGASYQDLFFATATPAPINIFNIKAKGPSSLASFPVFYVSMSTLAMTITEQLIRKHGLFMEEENVDFKDGNGEIQYRLTSDKQIDIKKQLLEKDIALLQQSIPKNIAIRIEQAFKSKDYTERRLRLDVLEDATSHKYTFEKAIKDCDRNTIRNIIKSSTISISQE